MNRGCLSVGAIRLTAIASFNALVLLVSTSAFAQITPNNGRTIDLNRQLDQQLDIPLNNGTQGDARNQADLLLRLGGQAQRAGFLEKAITNWLQALEIYQELGDFQGLSLTYDYLGVTYAKLGRYQQAEDALRRRLGVARTQEDFQGQIYGLNNLGTLLLQAGRLDAAQATFTEALTIARSVKNQEGEGLTLSNLGLVAATSGNYFEAIKRYQTALNLRSKSGDPLGEANTRNNLGDAQRNANLHRDAVIAYRAALLSAENSRDVRNQFRALRGLVQSYSALGEYPLAFYALNQHTDLSQKEKNRAEELLSLRLSAQLFQATGNLVNARDFYEQAIALAGTLGDTQEEALLRNDLAQIIYRRKVD
ncbi:MAG TPA: tetratricopeptide repeat protein [Coleofasciculaceae cyanobacterium]|jgi:tetratricopeptide (TPR) repeat protein